MKFTMEHEWLRESDGGSVEIGITDYAQDQLGDIVYVEMPPAGTEIVAGGDLMEIESVKAVEEIKAPVGGTVVAVNERLADMPELINKDPLGEGWLLRMDNVDGSALEALMDGDHYRDYVAGL